MREILVFGAKTFKIKVPDDAKLTFGPFSPPPAKRSEMYTAEGKRGTLRVYGRTKDDILAVFSNVDGFRDVSLGYMEEVAREEGATIWKSDEHGYSREDKRASTRAWTDDPVKLIGGSVKAAKGKR
jgi:hypothetical protein